MHILLAILGALGVVAVLYYRFRVLGDATRDVIDTVETAQGAWRRYRFRKQAERPALETLKDPRAAAAAIMVATASAGRPLTENQISAIQKELGAIADDEEAAELVAYAQWLTKDVVDPNNVSLRVARLLNERLGENEKRDLIGMVSRVTTNDPSQLAAIATLKSRLAL